MGKLKLSGRVAWLIWALVHIAYLIGFRSRALVMLEWSWSYLTDQRGARLITADVEELMETAAAAHSEISPTGQTRSGRA